VKLNSQRKIEWDKTIGGNAEDQLNSLQQSMIEVISWVDILQKDLLREQTNGKITPSLTDQSGKFYLQKQLTTKVK